MNRRNFIINSAFTSTALISTNYLFSIDTDNERYNFNLNYAPHLGMFTNSAGTDPVDQLKFMYDQGFTAFEDNNMKKRDVNLQNRLADFMSEKRKRQNPYFLG